VVCLAGGDPGHSIEERERVAECLVRAFWISCRQVERKVSSSSTVSGRRGGGTFLDRAGEVHFDVVPRAERERDFTYVDKIFTYCDRAGVRWRRLGSVILFLRGMSRRTGELSGMNAF
jgi:hypothetical protein